MEIANKAHTHNALLDWQLHTAYWCLYTLWRRTQMDNRVVYCQNQIHHFYKCSGQNKLFKYINFIKVLKFCINFYELYWKSFNSQTLLIFMTDLFWFLINLLLLLSHVIYLILQPSQVMNLVLKQSNLVIMRLALERSFLRY